MIQSGFECALRQLQAAGVDVSDEVMDRLDIQKVWKELPESDRTASKVVKRSSSGKGKGKRK